MNDDRMRGLRIVDTTKTQAEVNAEWREKQKQQRDALLIKALQDDLATANEVINFQEAEIHRLNQELDKAKRSIVNRLTTGRWT